MAGDGESQAFAIELNGLLKAAGWTITSNPEQILTVPSPQGAFIVVDNAKAAPRYAAILQQAFQDIGYTLPGLQDPKIAQGKVVLLVGHRKQ
jgi:hypothetical protein